MFDVAIVGASSAGLYAALHLARAGRRVVVFERQQQLAPARRTLIITPKLQRLLDEETIAAAYCHQTPVMAVNTASAQCQVTLHEPDLIIERGALIHALAAQATEAGATVQYGAQLTALQPHREGAALVLRLASGEQQTVVARAVIGADGLLSTTAQAAGLPLPPAVPIVQAEVALPSDWNPERTQVWFDVDDTRFFYWLIPESPTHGVVGLVGDARNNTRTLLQRFLQSHGLEPLAYQASRVSMYAPHLRPSGRVGNAPVLLVGDAAGHVKVTTVGGSVSGFLGARAAVQSLLRGTPYGRELRALHIELWLHWLLREALERLDNAGYDRLVQYVTHPVRQFLSRYNRDEMAPYVWQVLFLEPRIVSFGLRCLLKPPRYAPHPPARSPAPHAEESEQDAALIPRP